LSPLSLIDHLQEGLRQGPFARGGGKKCPSLRCDAKSRIVPARFGLVAVRTFSTGLWVRRTEMARVAGCPETALSTRSGRAIRPWPGQGARFHDGRKYSRKKSGAPYILGYSPKTWRLQTSDEATRIRLGAQLKRWCLAWSGLIRAVFVIPHAGHHRCPAGNSRHADARRHVRRIPFPQSDLQSYRPDSTINQINRGELDILEAGAAVGRAIEIAGLYEHATDSYSS
jgi:hypothetical protein